MSIIQNLAAILAAKYGRDVRQAIHDAIEDCYNDIFNGDFSWVTLIAQEAGAARDLAEGYAAQLASGVASPAGTYATIAALASVNPDHSKIYVVTADGHWYYWSGAAWADGGAYQTVSVADGSITPEKTVFFTTPTNLFTGENLAYGKRINSSTGELIDSITDTFVTDFTKIKPNTVYSSTTAPRIAYYQEDKTFISSALLSVGVPFTTPENAYWLRAAYDSENLTTTQINEGPVLLPYVSGSPVILGKYLDLEIPNGSVTPEKTSFLAYNSARVIDLSQMTSGLYAGNGIDIIANENYISSKTDYYVSVNPVTKYTIPVNPDATILWYDEDKALLAKVTVSGTAITLVSEVSPAKARYAKFSYNVKDTPSRDWIFFAALDSAPPVYMLSSEVSQVGPIRPDMTTFIAAENNNLLDTSRLTNGYYNDYGTAIISNQNHVTNDLDYYIDVDPDTYYTIPVDATSGSSFIWYDADNAFIRKETINALANGEVIPATSKSPSNAAYLKVTINVKYTINGDNVAVYKYNGFPPKYKLSSDIAVKNRLTNNFYVPSVVGAYDGVTNEDSEEITVSQIYAKWDALIAVNPNNFTKTVLGKDASGVFDILEIEYRPTPPISPIAKISVSANIHGNGNGGDSQDAAITLYELFKAMTAFDGSNEALNFLRFNVQFNIIPIVNPWGFDNLTRLNSNSIDLNRDMDSATPQAETVILRDFLSRNANSNLYLDIHCWASGPTDFEYRLYYTPNTYSISYEVLTEVGGYVKNRQNAGAFTMSTGTGTLSTDGYASYVEGIPAITSEFPTYATGKTTHGSEMMTNFLELVGNILYRTAVRF